MNTPRSYTLNADSAKQSNSSRRIEDTGPYSGAFTRAEAVVSTKGTEGIEFSFVDRNGLEASFLSLWTVKMTGEQLQGRRTLDAMMACAQVRTLTPTDAMVEKWVGGVKGKVRSIVYPELMNKPIGLLLSREPYEDKNGEVKFQFQIEAVYEVKGHRTAANVLDQKPDDGTLDKWIARLADRPLKRRLQTNGYTPHGGQPDYLSKPASKPVPPVASFADMDDDIPF